MGVVDAIAHVVLCDDVLWWQVCVWTVGADLGAVSLSQQLLTEGRGDAIASMSCVSNDVVALAVDGRVAVARLTDIPAAVPPRKAASDGAGKAASGAKAVTATAAAAAKAATGAKPKPGKKARAVVDSDDSGADGGMDSGSDGGDSDDDKAKGKGKGKSKGKGKTGVSKVFDMEAADDGDADDDADRDDDDDAAEAAEAAEAAAALKAKAAVQVADANKRREFLEDGIDVTDDLGPGDAIEGHGAAAASALVLEAQEAFQPGSTSRPTYSATTTQRYLMAWNRTGTASMEGRLSTTCARPRTSQWS